MCTQFGSQESGPRDFRQGLGPQNRNVCWGLLYYNLRYFTLVYYTILYYTIIYYTILYYTILYYIILYYNILSPYYYYTNYIILYYTILIQIILNTMNTLTLSALELFKLRSLRLAKQVVIQNQAHTSKGAKEHRSTGAQ